MRSLFGTIGIIFMIIGAAFAGMAAINNGLGFFGIILSAFAGIFIGYYAGISIPFILCAYGLGKLLFYYNDIGIIATSALGGIIGIWVCNKKWGLNNPFKPYGNPTSPGVSLRNRRISNQDDAGLVSRYEGDTLVIEKESDSSTNELTITRADANDVNKTCPYDRVKIEIGDEIIRCPHCETPHHAECWKENDGCTTYGCKHTPVGRR